VTELLSAGELLDQTLTTALGPVDHMTGEAIAGICNDALRAVLGPAVISVLHADRRRIALVAPWVGDLARGLQFQARHRGPESATADLLIRLSRPGLAPEDARRLAETVDPAVVMTLDRTMDHVLGSGACARDPRANDGDAPWLAGLKLGSRIRLVLELLRLMPPTPPAATL
jgi:hypothetical protein